MYRIGIIGDRDSVLGFKAVGLDVFPTADINEARKTLHEWAESGCAIIYVTESFAARMEKDMDKYKDSRLPAIIPIPGREGPSGEGMRSVRKSVERAVGADILFGGGK